MVNRIVLLKKRLQFDKSILISSNQTYVADNSSQVNGLYSKMGSTIENSSQSIPSTSSTIVILGISVAVLAGLVVIYLFITLVRKRYSICRPSCLRNAYNKVPSFPIRTKSQIQTDTTPLFNRSNGSLSVTSDLSGFEAALQPYLAPRLSEVQPPTQNLLSNSARLAGNIQSNARDSTGGQPSAAKHACRRVTLHAISLQQKATSSPALNKIESEDGTSRTLSVTANSQKQQQGTSQEDITLSSSLKGAMSSPASVLRMQRQRRYSTATFNDASVEGGNMTRLDFRDTIPSPSASAQRRASAVVRLGGGISPLLSASPGLLGAQAGSSNFVGGSRERFSICDSNSLDWSLYQQDDDDPNQLALNMYGLGKLCFTLTYEVNLGLLHCHLHRAAYLPTIKTKTASNFYVKISLLPTETNIHRSSVVSTTRSAEFDEHFTFSIPPDQVDGRNLQFQVKEALRLEKNSVIGYVWFRLSQRYLLNTNQIALQDIWRDIIGPEKVMSSLGQILVSLCYRRSENAIRLRIYKCKNLAVRSQDNSVYVRASLMSADRALKTKRTHSTKRELANANLDEPISFQLETGRSLDSVCIVLHVCSKTSLGFCHLIGKCVIGPVNYTEGDGLNHWSEMQEKVGSPVLFWHTLE